MIGRMNNTNVALIDKYYGQSNGRINSFCIGGQKDNRGGWQKCNMRINVLSNNLNDTTQYSPMEPKEYSLLGCLPEDLRQVMKSCTKYTDGVGSASTTEAIGDIVATKDYMCVASEYEVFGTIKHANRSEADFQEQYTYYANGNDIVSYRYDNFSYTAYVGLRSVLKSSYYQQNFVDITTGGLVSNTDGGYSYGIRPIFFV